MDLIATRTNRKFYRIPSDVASVLLELFPEQIKHLEPLPVPPEVPRFSVGAVYGTNGERPTVCRNFNGEVSYFEGNPDALGKTWKDVPQSVVDRYKQAWQQRQAFLGNR